MWSRLFNRANSNLRPNLQKPRHDLLLSPPGEVRNHDELRGLLDPSYFPLAKAGVEHASSSPKTSFARPFGRHVVKRISVDIPFARLSRHRRWCLHRLWMPPRVRTEAVAPLVRSPRRTARRSLPIRSPPRPI